MILPLARLKFLHSDFWTRGCPIAMGSHFTPAELDNIMSWKEGGHTPIEIHARLVKGRKAEKPKRKGPDLTTVRRYIKGKTFKRSAVETRGRKKVLTQKNLQRLDEVRQEMITKVDGERGVHWKDVMRKARIPTADESTVAKRVKEAFGVQARTPRLKPSRGDIDEAERKRIANKLRKHPPKFWTKDVHLFMDNKKWPYPRSLKGKKYLKQTRVRRHLRKRSEGLTKGFTKPDKRKHRSNLGGINMCAGIIKGRVRVWHYIDGTWNGDKAADLYRTVVHPALVKHHGKKRQFTILEDNDPTGYKSNRAKDVKAELKIVPIEFPRYSPDLNPCDYALWEELQNRMAAQKAPANESLAQFKARLRKTALAIPEKVVERMLSSMVGRTQGIYKANGGHIPRD